ncbi:MAG TPA: FixH family protein [Pseudidiomarina sp.]|nr:FixH family protein [Pseudidiomarina sp.]
MKVKPWYKQFWPWFLMGLPFSVIIAMIITLTIASRYGDNPMVVDDYYKKGRGINVQVEKVQAAQKLNISFIFQHDTDNFTLTYATGKPSELTALRVSFYHSTLSARDFEQVLTADAEGVFRGQLPPELAGKWTITVTPFNNAWRLSQSIQMPTVRALTLKPLTYGV